MPVEDFAHPLDLSNLIVHVIKHHEEVNVRFRMSVASGPGAEKNHFSQATPIYRPQVDRNRMRDRPRTG